jgi:5-aminolevulinate synthase
MMDFETRFRDLIVNMKLDGRYRTFIELERMAGEFPTALWHCPDGDSRRVTVWCSNDYLGMGQHPDVLAAMHKTIDRSGAGTGGTGKYQGQTDSMSRWRPSRRPAQQGSGADFTSGWISNLAGLGTLGRLMPDCMAASSASDVSLIQQQATGQSLEKPA